MRRILAAWKWLLSFRSTTWELSDYPVEFRTQDVADMPSTPRNQPMPVSAHIINWWAMSGHGDTREEALANLRGSFERYRDSHDAMPRPGTGAPLEYASSVVVDRHADIARDFLQRIFGLDYDDCFISDQSSLWEFHHEETNDELYRKIAIIYGVDVSDVPDARLAGIFERLAQR